MKTSEQINEIAAALAKAQAEILPVKKDAENPFFKSKYADLQSIREACRLPLSKHGLSITQPTWEDEKGLIMACVLMHTSGQWIRGDYRINPAVDKNGVATPQAIGSAITYARRYSLAAIVGVVTTDEEDDGNEASKTTYKAARQSQNAEYNQRKAGFVVKVPLIEESELPDWDQWAGDMEGMLGMMKTMDDISLLKKANNLSFRELEKAEPVLHKSLVAEFTKKANALA